MISRGLVIIITYFILLGALIGVLAVGLPSEDRERMNFSNPAIPNFDPFKTYGNTSHDLNFLTCEDQTYPLIIDTGSVRCDPAKGIVTNSTGLTRVFILLPANDTGVDYTNTYTYENPNCSDAKFFMAFGYGMGFAPADREVFIDDEGYHYRSLAYWGLYTNEDIVSAYPNAHCNNFSVSTIVRPYYQAYSVDTLGTLYLRTFDSIEYGPNTGLGWSYYAGWEASGMNFSVSSFDSNVNTYKFVPPPTGIGVLDALRTVGSTITQALELVGFILGLIIWIPNTTDTVEIIVNLLIFKVPLVILGVYIISWLKPIGAD